MADEPLRSALSERDHQHLFRHEIAPLYFPEGLGRAAAPTATFLGGQSGAGRTRLLHEVTAALTAQGPTVVIGGADLRPFHPTDGHPQRTDPLGAAHATDPDTRRWVEMLIAEGRRRGVHLVIDGSLGRPEVFAHRAGALRAAGYRVEAHVLAVSPEWSWQGVHQRRERLIAQGGAPRVSTRDAHDAIIAGLLRTLEAIDVDGLADHVRVTTRAGQMIYHNSCEAGAWQRASAAAAAVRQERERPLSAREIERFKATWTAILTQMGRRRAPAEEVERVTRQVATDLAVVRHRSEPPQRAGTETPTAEYTLTPRRGAEPAAAALDALAERITAKKAELDARRLPSPGALHALERWLDVELTYTSTAIAGNTLTRSETAMVLRTGVAVGGKPVRDHLDVLNYAQALAAVKELATRPGPIREHDLRQVHAVVRAGLDLEPGHDSPRPRDLPGSTRPGPTPIEGSGLMGALTDWLSQQRPTPDTAFEAHARLVEIHPFRDGNGRTGRLLMTAVLLQGGYPPVVLEPEERRRYVDALGARQRGEREPFRALMMEKLNAALDQHLEAFQRGIAVEQALGPELGSPTPSRAADWPRAAEQPVTALDRVPEPAREPVRASPSTQAAEPEPAWLLPPRNPLDLSDAEIAERARSSAVMQRQRETIAARARITFGHDGIGDRLMEVVEQNPSQSTALARSLATNPERYGALAGAPGRWLRPDSQERQQAKAELIQLSHAVEDYGRALEAERRRVIQEHQAAQKRAQIGVPAPTPMLQAVLDAPEDQRNRRLTAASVRDELSRLNLSLHERLSSHERRSIAAGNTASLSHALGVDPNKAIEIAHAVRQVQQTHERTQSLHRPMTRGRTVERDHR